MKTEVEIKFKIAVHESKIDEILKDEGEWLDIQSELIDNYLMGRKALLWVLSPDDFITEDEFEKKVKFELACHESSNLF